MALPTVLLNSRGSEPPLDVLDPYWIYATDRISEAIVPIPPIYRLVDRAKVLERARQDSDAGTR